MPTIICPECLQQLTITDIMVDKAVRCPLCKHTFTATLVDRPPQTSIQRHFDPEIASDLPQNDDFGQFPPTSQRIASPAAWKSVRSALHQVFVTSIIMWFVGFASSGMLVLSICGGESPRSIEDILSIILGCSILPAIPGFLFFVAQARALLVPPESRARAYIAGSMTCLVFFGFFCCALGWLQLTWDGQWAVWDSRQAIETAGVFFALSLILAGSTFFVLFLRAIALHFNNEALVRECNIFLVFYASLWIVFGALAGLLLAMGTFDRPPAGLAATRVIEVSYFSFGVLAMATAGFWFICLVSRTRDTIDAMTTPINPSNGPH